MIRMTYDYFVSNILNNDDFAFYFDTNTLLGLYKKSNKAIEYYSENMQRISNAVRIPSTVVKEYRKNEERKKVESKSELEFLIKSELLGSLNKFDIGKFAKLETLLTNNGTHFNSDTFTTLKENFIDRREEIINFIGSLNIDVNSDKNDIASDFIENFMLDLQNILPDLSRLEKNRYMIEGYTRVKHHLPPGYMDVKDKYHKLKREASKKGDKLLKPEALISYLGDYFVWSEILKDVKERDADALFITSDLKEDWWNVPDDTTDLESYSPREELLEEFEELTSRRVSFIPFDLFIRYLEIYNQQGIVANYLAQNTDTFENELFDRTLSLIQDRVDTNIAYDSIVYNPELTRGYVPYNWSIESTGIEITSIEVNNYDELDDGGILFQLNISVDSMGDFELDSGLEGSIYHSVSGEFNVSDTIVHAEVKISSAEVEDIKATLDVCDSLTSIDDVEILELYIDDSGVVSTDYEDPEEQYLDDYYQWAWDRDEERYSKW
ncbi:hypothetical protein J5O02_07295 [Streptococcus suis]|uniref:PIN-like domain-containing protein n=1 Tax=Streptococcus suis TaxID=1307 RepID=UPI000CF63F80|nr:PIN-like domain-containing protein [Streptococcus suis]MBO3756853.1 hypothetical protein [Streptococcus suis]